MIKRKEYLEILHKYKEKQLIKVVTDIRRCGKPTLMMKFQNKLLETEVNKE